MSVASAMFLSELEKLYVGCYVPQSKDTIFIEHVQYPVEKLYRFAEINLQQLEMNNYCLLPLRVSIAGLKSLIPICRQLMFF